MSAPLTQPGTDALSQMLASQLSAVQVVGGAQASIARAASVLAEGLKRGARLHYAAAGSSGLMALADAAELPGTFGIAPDQIAVHMAGGVPVDGVMPGDTEDDADAALRAAASVAAADVAIVVSASGTTPYALAFAKAAKAGGAHVIGLANVAGSALLEIADIAIALPTGAEFVEGSTRLGAGTAQKVALNMMSTLAGIHLGHVHDGLMVNLNPDNIKLRKRAADIVSRIAGVPLAEAGRALEATGYNAKAAVLVARGLTAAEAKARLEEHDGFLGACLAGPRAETQDQT
ncbi:MAG: N-acetylmuramic acid 6-phosphate etherase [Rhodobacteraceae bacterium]|nr:N-acetylmuramic acid 6-phosphate etherase [Paracoccaceae bacterium]